MQVILLERIAKLGQMGDIVTVKPGFARNFLLPRAKALRATEANKKKFESQRAQLEARNLELKTEAERIAEQLAGQTYIVIRQAGDTGQLYGSVSTRDIAEAISESGVSVERRQVMLESPIKSLGLHELKIQLHPEVEVGVTANVARSEEEAERQAAGEDVTVIQDDLEELFDLGYREDEDDDGDGERPEADEQPGQTGDEAEI
ncbi:MAG: 50S ribosomal protein L9 [Pseudomonadota bacterium]